MVHQDLLEKARQLEEPLFQKEVRPVTQIQVHEAPERFVDYEATPSGSVEAFHQVRLKQDDIAMLDFGEHLVGYLNLTIQTHDAHADAPLRLKLTFGETPAELAIPSSMYKGRLSRGWVQEEIVTIDEQPCKLTFPRRYAFRYLRIEVVGLSPFYSISIPDISCTAVTAADESTLEPLPEGTDADLVAIDRGGTMTLRECMQNTFEDGVKRDLRFWTGDSYYAMKTNLYTYKNFKMNKRMLYLIAALPLENGLSPACIYLRPECASGHENILDYSMIFFSMIADYCMVTGDYEIARELWPIVKSQKEIIDTYIQENGLVDDKNTCFPWSGANKQVAAQGWSSMAYRDYALLAEWNHDEAEKGKTLKQVETIARVTVEKLYDPELGLFVSGPKRELSWKSQVYAVMAGFVSAEEGKQIFERMRANPDCRPMESPATYGWYVEALLKIGEKDKAIRVIKDFWGFQLREGPGTYFEHYNPEGRYVCPWMDPLVDSYCHEWGSIIAYIIRRYLV